MHSPNPSTSNNFDFEKEFKDNEDVLLEFTKKMFGCNRTEESYRKQYKGITEESIKKKKEAITNEQIPPFLNLVKIAAKKGIIIEFKKTEDFQMHILTVGFQTWICERAFALKFYDKKCQNVIASSGTWKWNDGYHKDSLYKNMRYLNDVNEFIEELKNNMYEKAWKKIDTFRGEAQLSTWIGELAKTEASLMLRVPEEVRDILIDVNDDKIETVPDPKSTEKQKIEELMEELVEEGIIEKSEMEELMKLDIKSLIENIYSKLYQKLNEVIKELPDKYRKPIILHCFENMKYKDIATWLEMSINTVKSNIQRGKNKLKKNKKLGKFFKILKEIEKELDYD